MENSRLKRKSSKGDRKKKGIIIYIVLWFVLVAGFTFTYKFYMDIKINEVRMENLEYFSIIQGEIKDLETGTSELNKDIKSLNKEVEIFNDGIDELIEGLEDIDVTIGSTEELQDTINNKLKELDDRLIELKKSLDILREAPANGN